MASGSSPVHDSAIKWPALPDWEFAGIEREGWRARPVLGLSQVLVSGDFGAALVAHAPGATEVGLWAVAEGDPVALRIARDRVLLVGSGPLDVPLGWNGSWAASTAGDAWFVVDMEGPAMADVIREGTAADLDASSPSAAILFAGVQAILYRRADRRARLHVEAPHGPYLWRWLEARAG
jgi:sarcosine oxidase gamma subunit